MTNVKPDPVELTPRITFGISTRCCMSAPEDKPVSDTIRFRWDILLFAVFIASAVPAVTRIPSHEWLGLTLVPVLLVHLLFNWRWIANVTRRVFRPLPAEIRFNHLWDMLLFFLLTAVMVSGALISESALPAMGFQIRRDPFWRALHNMSATLLLIALGVHLAMHARWILARIRKKAPRSGADDVKAGPS